MLIPQKCFQEKNNFDKKIEYFRFRGQRGLNVNLDEFIVVKSGVLVFKVKIFAKKVTIWGLNAGFASTSTLYIYI